MLVDNYREFRLVLITNYINNDDKDKLIRDIIDNINPSMDTAYRTYISNRKQQHAYTMTKYKYSEENTDSISMLKDFWRHLELDEEHEHRVLIIDECLDYILNQEQDTYDLIESINNSQLSKNVTCIYAINNIEDIPPTIKETFNLCPCIKIDIDNVRCEMMI